MFGSLASLLLAGLAAGSAGSTELLATEDGPAEQRVRAIAASAWEGPDFLSAMADLDSDRAMARLDAHPGAPYTEVQREGIDAGLGKAGNAAWYLRVGAPLNAPWQRGAIRGALEAADRQLLARRRLVALETAGDTVGAWLELAAIEARLAVQVSQSDRLSDALALQRTRLKLGEISGAEVTQLELEHLRLLSTVSRLRAERVAAAQAVERRVGRDAPQPRPGDLQGLQASLSPWDGVAGLDIAKTVDSSPVLAAAALRTERVRREGQRDRRTVWGVPEAELSWERIPSAGGVEGFDAVGVRVRVPLPIGGLGQRQAADARARQRVAEAHEERTRRNLAAAIHSAAERSRAAAESLEALATVERDLERVERSVRERYRLGAVPYLEYIDGLQRLDEVRTLAIDARLERLRASLDLAVLTGDLTWFPLPDFDLEEVR